MVQVPDAINVAVEPETVQMAGVVDVKLTGRLELAMAVSASVEKSACAGIEPMVTVCCVLPIPEPLNKMLCVAYPGAVALSVLSVSTIDPVKFPPAGAVKLMGNKQDCPAASVPTVEEPVMISGHADFRPLPKVKFVPMLGLFPLFGIGKFNVALPTFMTVTVRGLSLLVEPGAVNAKLTLGGSARSSFNTR